MSVSQPYPQQPDKHPAPTERLIRENEICRELAPSALEKLLSVSRIDSLMPGDTLFRQGEVSHFFHIPLEGKVSITSANEQNETTVVEILGSGHILLLNSGQMGLPCLTTAQAATRLQVLVTPSDIFQQILETEPSFALMVYRQLAMQMRMLINNLRQVKLQNVSERLAHYLLSMLHTDKDSSILDLQEERRVIAKRLGTTPESLSRAFADLREQGVTVSGRTIRIADTAALRQFCGLQIYPGML